MERILLLLIGLVFYPLKAFGIEDKIIVDMEVAMNVALSNNIDLKSAKLNIDIAKNNIKTANRLQNPSIDSFYFLGKAGNNEPRQIGLSQNIEIAKRKNRKNLAKSNLELVKKDFEYTAFDLKMDVREAYVNLIEAKSILHTLEQQQALQEELLKIAKNRVEYSKTPVIDAIQAEIALNQIVTQVNTAKVNVKNALSLFNKCINDPQKTIYDSSDNIFAENNNFEEMQTPPPTLKYPDFSEIAKKALSNRFDIKIAKQNIDIAEKELKLVASQKIPDLKISGGYGFIQGKYTDNGSLNNGAYVGASLINIPVFYNYSPEIQNATLKLQQSEFNYQSIENKAIKDISMAYERFLTAKDNLNRYESNIVVGSEKLIETSKESYLKGEISITALIVMKQSYKSIIIGYTQALAEYYNSWTNFLREVNNEDFNIIELL